jgi:hypothetical protein
LIPSYQFLKLNIYENVTWIFVVYAMRDVYLTMMTMMMLFYGFWRWNKKETQKSSSKIFSHHMIWSTKYDKVNKFCLFHLTEKFIWTSQYRKNFVTFLLLTMMMKFLGNEQKKWKILLFTYFDEYCVMLLLFIKKKSEKILQFFSYLLCRNLSLSSIVIITQITQMKIMPRDNILIKYCVFDNGNRRR